MKNLKIYFIKYIVVITITTSHTFAANIHTIKDLSDHESVDEQLIKEQKEYKEKYIKSELAKTEFSKLKQKLREIREELIPMQRQIKLDRGTLTVRVTELKKEETLVIARMDSILKKIEKEAASKYPTGGYDEFMKTLKKIRKDAIEDIEQTDMRIHKIQQEAKKDEKRLNESIKKNRQNIEQIQQENIIGIEKVIQTENELKKMKEDHKKSMKKGLDRKERYQAQIERQNEKLEKAKSQGKKLSASTTTLPPTSSRRAGTICTVIGIIIVGSYLCSKKVKKKSDKAK